MSNPPATRGHGGSIGGRKAAIPPFGETIGLAFRAFFRNAGVCLAVAGAEALPAGLASSIFAIFFARKVPTRQQELSRLQVDDIVRSGIRIAIVCGALFLLSFVISLVVYPALGWVGARAASNLSGFNGPPLADVIEHVRDRWTSGAVALLLAAIVPGLPMIGLGLLALSFLAIGLPEIAILTMLLMIPAAIWPGFVYWIRFCVAPVIAVTEDVTPRAALRRSADLVGGSFWYVFGVLALTGLAASVGASVVAGIFSSAGPALLLVAQVVTVATSTAVSGVAVGVVYATLTGATTPPHMPETGSGGFPAPQAFPQIEDPPA